jgi:threonine aldolase
LRARGWKFNTGGVTPGDSRLMCSWDTTPGDVDAFVTDLREISA